MHVTVPPAMHSTATGMCGDISKNTDWKDPTGATDSFYTFGSGETYESITSEKDYKPTDSCGADTAGQALLNAAKAKCAAACNLGEECVKDVCAFGDVKGAQPMIDACKEREARIRVEPKFPALAETVSGPNVACSSFGDPHFVGFNGRKFNFYGLGLFWLFSSAKVKVQALHTR